MKHREILARREAIRGELRSLLEKHPDGGMPADVEQRVADLEAEAGRLNDAERRQALLDDLDRRAADAKPVEERGDANDGAAVFGLTAEQRMADYIARTRGERAANLSAGRMIRGLLTGRWDGAEAERRAMGTGVSTAGGYLLPEPVSGNLIDLARNQSVVVKAGALTVPMENQTLRVVRVLTDPTATWRAEGSAIPESEGTFGAIELTARSLAAMVRVNNELLDDAPMFAATLDQQLAAALALELDRVGLYGSGSSGQPQGLRTLPGVVEMSMGANGALMNNHDSVMDLIQAIEEANGSPTAAIMAPRTRNKLSKLYTGISGDQTRLTPPAEYTALRRLVSNQVSVTETQGSSNAASTMFVGGFQNMAFAIRQQITIEASRVADDTFAKNQTLVRAIMRADVAVYRPSHFGRLVGIL